MLALTSDRFYQGSVREGIPNGKGIIWDIPSRSMVFEGTFQNGRYDGFGTEYRGKKVLRKGVFRKGELTKGRMVCPNGCVLDGTIVGEQLHGKGRFTVPSGAYIEGTWNEGSPRGVCTVFIMQRKQRTPIMTTYDFDHPDDDTKFTVRFLNDCILYEDKYLVDHSQPMILCYFNGDVFVGNTTFSLSPSRGYYFCYKKNGFEKMQLDGGLDNLQVDLCYSSSDSFSEVMMDLIE